MVDPSLVRSQAFAALVDEYQDYFALTERSEEELRDDVDVLQAQEGYDADKTHAFLLNAVSTRVSLELHAPIPPLPYSQTPLFFVLPLPRHTDRLGRPIAVLTLREVVRDESGLDGLKEWLWWALELVRRVLQEWTAGRWKRGRRGSGGEGCVLLVDADSAGYRNMEVDLFPTLFNVGHNHFPGLFQAVYIVNASWSHRTMWNSVVKRVLPRSALNKISFLQTRADVEAIFVPAVLPRVYGGDNDYVFTTAHNPVLGHYARPPQTAYSRVQSAASIADVFHSARASPYASRPISRVQSHRSFDAFGRQQSFSSGLGLLGMGRLGMTRSREATKDGVGHAGLEAVSEKLCESTRSSAASDTTVVADASRAAAMHGANGRSADAPQSLGRGESSRSGAATPTSAMQRVKSLSNFHLYLSPSRLAHRDLLSDSEDDEPAPRSTQSPRLALRHGAVGSQLAMRRARPVLRLNAQSSDDPARSYSSRLQQHHARGVELYSHAPSTPVPPGTETASESTSEPVANQSTSQAAIGSPPPGQAAHAIPAYSSSANPWFGYPAELVPDPDTHRYALRPRYMRNRKRDLVKTLLFLFTLRLQAWRDAVERALGLRRWEDEPHEPSAGLARAAGRGSRMSRGKSRALDARVRTDMVRSWDRDWLWMVVGFLVMRGTWTRVLAGALDWIGLESLKVLCGLV